MKENYHIHTWRCNHASGTEREYIEEALRGGIKVLGFSDHSPMPFPQGYRSGIRMDLDQLQDYCDTLLALKKEYEKDIEIHIGLEAEYYPQLFDGLMDFLKDYPIEYLLLGQHCLDNEYEDDSVWSSTPSDDPEFLKKYVDQTCEGMRSGCFLYLAHPDLVRFTGEREQYRREMRKLCRTAKEMGMPLEINLLGVYEKRHYPNPEFWKIAGEEGNDVVLGIDCHHVEMMNLRDAEQEARELAGKYGLRVLPSIGEIPHL